MDGFLGAAPREKPPRAARANRTEPNRPTDETTRAQAVRGEDDTILFDDGAKIKVQTVAREIYDESPAMQSAHVCLSWRPQTKKKEDPAGSSPSSRITSKSKGDVEAVVATQG